MEAESQNFDDMGPRNITELTRQIGQQEALGDVITEVIYQGNPVGAVGYLEVTPELGTFRGIVFTKAVHGTGVPFAAVAMVLEDAFNNGTRKVFSKSFEDNIAVCKFLKKLGAQDEEGIDAGHTTRGGAAVKWTVASIRADDFRRSMASKGAQELARA